MREAGEKAREFLQQEKAFRLGELLTESSHPKTRALSQTIQADLESNPNLNYTDYAATLNGLFETVAGMDYVVSETIAGQERQHQAYQRVMEEA